MRTPTGRTRKNRPARVPPQAKPHEAGVPSLGPSDPRPGRQQTHPASTRTPKISSSSSKTVTTASNPSAKSKKCCSCASPPRTGASTAPSPWKPASSATASRRSSKKMRTASEPMPVKNSMPNSKALRGCLARAFDIGGGTQLVINPCSAAASQNWTVRGMQLQTSTNAPTAIWPTGFLDSSGDPQSAVVRN